MGLSCGTFLVRSELVKIVVGGDILVGGQFAIVYGIARLYKVLELNSRG